VGHRGDTGAIVLVVSEKVKSLPDSVALGLRPYDLDGVYYAKVDGAGNYTISNIPAGKYYIVVISKNTNENMNNVVGAYSWGKVYSLFSEKGKENALLTAKIYKTRSDTITIYGNRSTVFSYDFGITFI
jgi:hypothetical protein